MQELKEYIQISIKLIYSNHYLIYAQCVLHTDTHILIHTYIQIMYVLSMCR